MKLPVDEVIGEIVEALKHSSNVVLEAPPGAGKTTRVPPALLGVTQQDVIVLEPRRIAARMAARRVASERRERVGETVGYQVRFDEVAGPATRLRFLTEGVLTRRLLSDLQLHGVGIVCLDEFHERHMDGDLALALLRRLQQTVRLDLKLVVMSATLEAAPVVHFLGDCPVVRSEGRLFDLSITHLPYSGVPLEEQTASAIERALTDPASQGDILVFLPGAGEIRRTARLCTKFSGAHNLLVLPLHGDLSPEEQDRAVTPASQRKVILATNVAESSITVEGVDTVIDSGLARIASDSPWTGLPTLEVSRISKASATQRAGRAGRTKPGRVLRLYTADDLARRASHDPPEISRRELAQLYLDLCVAGVSDPTRLDWLTPPDPAHIEAAKLLLHDLGALDQQERLTEIGREMSRLPLHPRLARVIVEAARLGTAEEGCRAVAILSAGSRVESLNFLEAIDQELSPPASQIFRNLLRMMRRSKRNQASSDALERSLLAGFPDRVARRRLDRQTLLATGQGAEIAADARSEFFLALDIEDRKERSLPLVRLLCPIQPDLLIDGLEERNTVEWNRAGERVDAVSALMYRQLTIEESRGARPDPVLAADLLAKKAVEAGIARFADAEELDELLARIRFASEHGPFQALNTPDVEDALRELCYGLRSFAELKSAAAGLLPLLIQKTGDAARFDAIALRRIDLPRRKNVRIRYATDRPPWIESRLQDFFGVTQTPRIAQGQVPLVIHLLAPNHRPVQTTTDLEGFWKRLYPQVRKELSRRYPKHAWPEVPS